MPELGVQADAVIYDAPLTPYEVLMLYTNGHPIKFRLSCAGGLPLLKAMIRVLRGVGIDVSPEVSMKIGCGYY